eukprot:TRINITY_DN68344_c0_g1_i1.p1 TRINITY_DN68344_c0_g1~~TRINITY_DN68344_c0_g1_i1.p1  ORF type:complete len:726 (+),score=108.71 TRINITY_DN68344_c0_g1_i1:122-2299(+)
MGGRVGKRAPPIRCAAWGSRRQVAPEGFGGGSLAPECRFLRQSSSRSSTISNCSGDVRGADRRGGCGIRNTKHCNGADVERKGHARKFNPSDHQSMPTVRVECECCHQVVVIFLNDDDMTCSKCGATIRLHLAAALQHFHDDVEKLTANADRQLGGILREHGRLCNSLLESSLNQFTIEEALWISRYGALAPQAAEVCAEIRQALESGSLEEVAVAVEDAQSLSLPLSSDRFLMSLSRLQRAEDLEVVWRCLRQAVRDRDRTELLFWLQEGTAQGLELPRELAPLLRSLELEERCRLSQIGFQHAFEERVERAFRAQDFAALEMLMQEARQSGADPAPAEAALIALQADCMPSIPPEPVEEELRSLPSVEHVNPKKPSRTEEMRTWSIERLKAEVTKLGLPLEGASQREELLQLLAAVLEAEPGSNDDRMTGSASRQSTPSGMVAEYYSARFGRWLPVIIDVIYPDGTARLLARDRTPMLDRVDQKLVRPAQPFRAHRQHHARDPVSSGRSYTEQAKIPSARRNSFRDESGGYRTGGWQRAGVGGNMRTTWSSATSGHGDYGRGREHFGWQPGAGARVGGQSTKSSADLPHATPPENQYYKRQSSYHREDQFQNHPYQNFQSPPSSRERLSSNPSSSTSTSKPPTPSQPLTFVRALARLELTGGCSPEELRSAYKRAALRWHPDRRQNHGKEEVATQRFQEAREAFEFLSNGAVGGGTSGPKSNM